MANKKALITGITGQIGSYLAQLLKEKGYDIYGVVRKKLDTRDSLHQIEGYTILEGDLEDAVSIERLIKLVQPDEIYNLGGQSDAQVSFHLPAYTIKVNGTSLLNLCEAAKNIPKPAKIFQAGSAELYGASYDYPVDENFAFHPRNPYAIGKLTAYSIITYYREKFSLYGVNGILFNSESPLRGENFVTKKIAKTVAEISKGKTEKLALGNLDAKRDWIHAKDTAHAIWAIMQTDKPSDYVVASGEIHSVREFVELAFKEIGFDIAWRGEGIDEIGYDKKTGKTYVVVDPLYFRPYEKNKAMAGNPTKIKRDTLWRPTYSLAGIVKEMVQHEKNVRETSK